VKGLVGLALQEKVPLLIRKDQPPEFVRIPLSRPELSASFVIPIYHEEHSLELFVQELPGETLSISPS